MHLRPLVLDDLAAVVRWSRDIEFCRANGWPLGRSEQEVRAQWVRLIEQPPAGFLRLGAEAGGELVGYADLADIEDGAAELGFAIGGSQRWGKGLGTATAAAMVLHAFDELGLELLRATVHEPNGRSIRVVRRLGFQEVGMLPELEEYLGERVRVVEFELRRRAGGR